MSLGMSDGQGSLLDDVARFCDEVLPESSIYSFLRRERLRLFPDEDFADLFDGRGRRSVPPSVVAVVMVLQRLEGLSDREAVERYCFDNRWRYAAGVGGYDTGGWTMFSHTVLVDMRERLRRSDRPDRVFEAALGAAKEAGVVGKKRALDSTPLYDAVATMDTVTLIRSAIRALLKVAPSLEAKLRGVMRSGDDYATSAKPQIDWDDPAAREALIDSRARDAYACLLLLEGENLDGPVAEAVQLLATVTGQDLEVGEDGRLRIARKVAKDRVISTVDPQARHGHKTRAHGFDGYKGHTAVDPDSEIITAATVTPGNAGDAQVADELISDLLEEDLAGETDVEDEPAERASVYGDNSYGTGKIHTLLAQADIESKCKTRLPTAAHGLFSKDRFHIDLDAQTVTCPAHRTVTIRPSSTGGGTAHFGRHCLGCPLAERCTRSRSGRTVSVGPHEAVLSGARARQSHPDWIADYRAIRPKVERKIAHLMRRRHGGRRARVRGVVRVKADFTLLAAAVNLARMAVMGLRWTPMGWMQPAN